MGRGSSGNVAATAGITIVLIWILAIVGWVINLCKCIGGFLDAPTLGEITTVTIIQLVGVFTGPVGSVMGWVIW